MISFLRSSEVHFVIVIAVHPLHRENRENGQKKKNPCQGKHRKFGNYSKTQGIWFAQVINSLILNVKDISLFAAKIPQKKLKLDMSTKSVLCM